MWPQELINEGQQILDSIHDGNITPKKEDVLRFLEIDPHKIKVVILGQDPYPTEGVANGRAFAVNKDKAIPQSLRNIFAEIEKIQGKVYADKTLDSWAMQGVLLLNASLTTIIGQSNTHVLIWKHYTEKIIKYLNDSFPNIIWVLWGNFANQFKNIINGKIISDAHPSPLSIRFRKGNTFKELILATDVKW